MTSLLVRWENGGGGLLQGHDLQNYFVHALPQFWKCTSTVSPDNTVARISTCSRYKYNDVSHNFTVFAFKKIIFTFNTLLHCYDVSSGVDLMKVKLN